MKKIEFLTPEQEADLPVFRQQYLDLACSGLRVDREALHGALTDAYAVIGKQRPMLFVFDSPAACMLAIKIIELGSDPKFKLGDQLGDQLWGQLWDQLGGQLWDQLGDQLRGQLGGQLWDQLGGQLRGQLWDQLGGQLWDQLWGQLRGQLWDQKIYNSNFLWGSQDLYWIAWGKFAEKIGVKLNPETSQRLDIMDRIGRQCEWWWPFENMVIASQRPTRVRFDEQRRLHAENGPAVEYADSYSLHAWHGTRVPADWIERPDSVDPVDVLKSQNVEQRSAGLAILRHRMIPTLIAQKRGKWIDDSGSPDIGKLFEVKLPDLPQPGRYLVAECPRNGTIMEGVPLVSDIDGLPINTAIAAQAWRIGDPQSEYAHPPRRT